VRVGVVCSGSEAGSYFRPIDFVYYSTLGLRVIKRERDLRGVLAGDLDRNPHVVQEVAPASPPHTSEYFTEMCSGSEAGVT